MKKYMHFRICWYKYEVFTCCFLYASLSPPFFAVDHVQIAVTCETDPWSGNLGASIKDKRGHKIMMMSY